MLFSSFEFLFVFLPAVCLVYFVTPRRWKNLALLLFSLFFYAFGEPAYLPLMVVTIALNYGFGRAAASAREKGRDKRARAWLGAAVVTDLLLLGFFKYYDFLAATLSRLPFVSLPTLGLPLPIGISFYTFQCLSYVIDVYRGERVQKDPIAFGTYIALFPQLIAGPIVRYGDVADALTERESTLTGAAHGANRFLCGLAKKVLLADTAGAAFAAIRALPAGDRSVLLAAAGTLAYALQIYFDFSGYSDMGIGLGEIFGFRFPENFRYPYAATSITDFWRRWHITLSTWFREYVYIPLGGNRRGRVRTVLNLLAVWLLTGLWHGASWNFLLWGFYYFLLLVLEKFVLTRPLARLPRPLRRVYTLAFVALGWLIFAFDDLAEGLAYARTLFDLSHFVSPGDAYDLLRWLPAAAIAAIAATPLGKRLYDRVLASSPGRAAAPFLSIAALLLSVTYLAASSFHPFLYFRF